MKSKVRSQEYAPKSTQFAELDNVEDNKIVKSKDKEEPLKGW